MTQPIDVPLCWLLGSLLACSAAGGRSEAGGSSQRQPPSAGPESVAAGAHGADLPPGALDPGTRRASEGGFEGFPDLGEPDESAAFEPRDACAGFAHKAEELPLDMYFLIDTSGSMAERTPGGSKWDLISTALVNFISEPRNASVGVGLGYFPAAVPPTCVAGDPGCLCIPFINLCLPNFGGSCDLADYSTPAVPLQYPLDAPRLISDIGARGLAGGTPTRPAVEGAFEYVAQWAEQNPGRRSVLVLATDGDPTGCGDNSPQAVANLAREAFDGPYGIRTFVIGVGGSLTSLNLVARAGGTTQAFLTETNSTLVQDFADALDRIRTEAAPCEYSIPREGSEGNVDASKINVLVTPRGASGPQTIPMAFDGASTNCGSNPGWYYDDPASPRSVLLCQRSCSDAFGAAVELQFGCETIVAPPR